MKLQFRKADISEISRVVDIHCNAFSDYPYALLFQKKYDEKFLHEIYGVLVKTYFKNHHCIVAETDNRIVACVLLKDKDKAEPNLVDFIAAGALKLILKNPLKALNTLGVMEESTSDIRKINKQWLLETLVVLKEYQGRRIGTRMLNEYVFPLVKENGGGQMTLITNSESNRKFYTKNGFEEFAERRLTRYGREIGNWSFKQIF